ncbi:RNA polymerase II transcriptional coactivator [Cimex lectularius]|uniref:Transcriptional coactivator p15 (PC4) C-terminal domain-containing protein n=1 Tax=Cimex lectularius TaxID=79782 RepID=A0A8I6RTV1_CIMLE|nr:RNA polymerase II transcriptional coactivator [Cimex lectularius]XP_014250843.1 RNA polymerase II transcriptional coactivator [Cimex lectularius]
MPETKSDSEYSDSGSEERPVKKQKVEKSKPKPKPKPSKQRDEDEEPSWSLDNRRFIKVREFRGKVMIDIREYYERDGDLLPGKKGICLSTIQWNKLKDIMSEVDEAIQKK